MSPAGTDKYDNWYRIAAVSAIGAVYILVRVIGLDGSCLWFDEIFSVHVAEHDWGTILPFVANDLIHPPLFYLLLKLWIGSVGEGLFWLRLLPAIFAIAAFIPAAALCRELGLKIYGTCIALLLFAVNGSLIKYSQEVRMYSLLLFVSVLSILIFVRFTRGKSSLVLLTVVNCLLVYTHYFGWFVVFAELIAVIVIEKKLFRRLLVSAAVAGAVFLPWLISVMNAAGNGGGVGQNIGWMVRPGIAAVSQFFLAVTEPFYFPISSLDGAVSYPVAIPVFLISLTALLIGLFAAARAGVEERRSTAAMAILFVVPLLGAFVVSWVSPYSVWGSRHLVIVFFPFMLMVGRGLDLLTVRWAKVLILLLVLILSGTAFVIRSARQDQQYIWCAWDSLAEQLTRDEHVDEKERVYAFEELIAYHLWYALKDRPNYNVAVVKGFEWVNDDTAYFLPRGFDDVQKVGVENAFSEERFWIAFRTPRSGPAMVGDASHLERPRIIDDIEKRGYALSVMRKLDVGPESAYLVEFARGAR